MLFLNRLLSLWFFCCLLLLECWSVSVSLTNNNNPLVMQSRIYRYLQADRLVRTVTNRVFSSRTETPKAAPFPRIEWTSTAWRASRVNKSRVSFIYVQILIVIISLNITQSTSLYQWTTLVIDIVCILSPTFEFLSFQLNKALRNFVFQLKNSFVWFLFSIEKSHV